MCNFHIGQALNQKIILKFCEDVCGLFLIGKINKLFIVRALLCFTIWEICLIVSKLKTFFQTLCIINASHFGSWEFQRMFQFFDQGLKTKTYSNWTLFKLLKCPNNYNEMGLHFQNKFCYH